MESWPPASAALLCPSSRFTTVSNDHPRPPRPFYDDAPPAVREAVQALYHWHDGLREAARADGPRSFAAEADRVLAEQPLSFLPEATARAAYRACRTHGLPLADLAGQVRAAYAWQGPLRFPSRADLRAFEEEWALSHGRQLARLADAYHRWQHDAVHELSRAFFSTARLMHLPDDLARDQLFIPLSDLQQVGVSLEELRAGHRTEGVQRLLWRQVVRARDAYGQAMPLVKDLDRRVRSPFKRWWLAGLEMLNQIERNGYDVWTQPPSLGWHHKVQIRLQAWFGKTTFRPR